MKEQYIPIKIEDDEVLVRFVYASNFKNKQIDLSRIDSRNVFLDTRYSSVSLQRYLYCSEDMCKTLAKSIPTKSTEYVGFALFKKAKFDEIVNSHKLERSDFEALLKYTPMNALQAYYEDIHTITINTEGNPAHSDIVYVNPGVVVDESPNTALRHFSHKLSVASVFVIDNCKHEIVYCGEKFGALFSPPTP